MFAQFFGNYLLNKKAVTPEQLNEAMSKLKSTRLKLGTLAIHEGLMTAAEVDEIVYLQSREDKRFGELAIARNYLTDEQVEDLLHVQRPDYLLLGQNLVDMGVLTNQKFQDLLLDYQNEAEIYDMDIESQADFEQLIKKFMLVSEQPVSDEMITYLKLFLNDLVRFIGEDFTPMAPVPASEYPVNFAIRQKIRGDFNADTYIDMPRETAVAFASRFASMEFNEFNEYVQAAIEDFLNLHNGLFGVNISNLRSLEVSLDPPAAFEEDLIELNANSFVIPFNFTFGCIHLIVAFRRRAELEE